MVIKHWEIYWESFSYFPVFSFREDLGFALLFGDHTRWNVDEARELFENLASTGSADAQLGLAFLYGTGIGVPEASQSKALLYYTFSALGGNPLAQMALVCFWKFFLLDASGG